MTSFNKKRAKLFDELDDKEYREAFVEENINIGIPFQIKALRKQRNWTQKDLAERSGMNQARISLLENLYESFSLTTLKKFASAFDVGLIVRFSPISEIVDWQLNLSSDSLEVPSYDEDEYFNESPDMIIMNMHNVTPISTASKKNISRNKMSSIASDGSASTSSISANNLKAEIAI